jgi:hypothetical protein
MFYLSFQYENNFFRLLKIPQNDLVFLVPSRLKCPHEGNHEGAVHAIIPGEVFRPPLHRRFVLPDEAKVGLELVEEPVEQKVFINLHAMGSSQRWGRKLTFTRISLGSSDRKRWSSSDFIA